MKAEEGRAMLVVVQYTDESYDMVIDYHLDGLINAGKIAGFSSADGWVRVLDVPAKDKALGRKGADGQFG
jgi:hypothetical protein